LQETAAEVLEVVMLLFSIVVVIAVTATELLVVDTVARRTYLLAMIVAAGANGATLVEVELMLLLDLVFFGNSERVAAVVLTFTVVRARATCSSRLLEMPSSISSDCDTKLGLSVVHTWSRHGWQR
jgi:ribulose 1,5-bisphosphate synthetase/thiazole synthase